MYKQYGQGLLKYIKFIVLDLFCIEVAFFFSILFHSNFISFNNSLFDIHIAILLIFIDLIVIVFFNIFNKMLKRGYYREFVATLWQTILIELLLVFFIFMSNLSNHYPEIIIITTGISYFVLNYFSRIMLKKYINHHLIRKVPSMLVVSNRKRIEECIDELTTWNSGNYKIKGIILTDNNDTNLRIKNIPITGTIKNILNYLHRGNIDEVLLDLSINDNYFNELTNKFTVMGMPFHISLNRNYHLPYGQQFVEKLGVVDVITTSMNTITSRQAFIKRTMDIIGGLIGTIFTGLLLLFIAPIIYYQSPGPILFKQTRVGKNGKEFKLYKIRSMELNAEKRKQELMQHNRVKDGMMFKIDFDERIIGNEILKDGTKKTGVGHLIRETSLDEFPQFLNVLKGDMSLVGTRPPTTDEWEKYDLHHRARLAIKPGITGAWQVSGRSNITDFEEVVKLDTTYIQNWDIGLDIKILLKTIVTVFKKDGAI